ncbi:MAG TPA: zinc-dependent alcohol dehydrogenase family protein [Burkholderiaceae bacterium]|nr:zinc-dependent alcohol dehydrogenase family protein [Burkholderiaceae bacterium]
MHAVRFSRFGPAHEVAELVEVPEPDAPGPGEVLLEIERSSINPADLLMFEGRYGAAPPKLPVWAGGEAVARVLQAGEGVTHLKPGDRVLALLAARGNWRPRTKAPAARLFALPEADLDQLAMLGVNPPTAWLMLHDFVSLAPGDWVMQNAGNSGVGQAVIQFAKRLGWRTVSVVRRPEQAAPLRAIGADAVVVDAPDLAQRVVEATGGARPRLGIDAVAGEATRRMARSLADGGTVVNYGLLSGQPCALDASDVVFRDVALRGFWLARWFAGVPLDAQHALYRRLGAAIADGTLRVEVEATYPLARVKEALAHAARPARGGKVLLAPNA